VGESERRSSVIKLLTKTERSFVSTEVPVFVSASAIWMELTITDGEP
jgi:hypothetical protein